MANQAQQETESVEDILQSIRKIISDEDQDASQDDAFELTELVEETADIQGNAQEPEDAFEDIFADNVEDVSEVLTNQEHNETVEEVIIAGAVSNEIAQNEIAKGVEENTKQETIEETGEQKGEYDMIEKYKNGAGTSLEALAVQAMTPHLKEWLDTNLKEIVREVVEEEIRKSLSKLDFSLVLQKGDK
jgi:cell pole-organizing protein PopZ